MPKVTAKESLPANFEQGLQELNALVAAMEAGDASLADMLANYQRGSVLLKFCEAQLKQAQEQLKQLDGDTLTTLTL